MDAAERATRKTNLPETVLDVPDVNFEHTNVTVTSTQQDDHAVKFLACIGGNHRIGSPHRGEFMFGGDLTISGMTQSLETCGETSSCAQKSPTQCSAHVLLFASDRPSGSCRGHWEIGLTAACVGDRRLLRDNAGRCDRVEASVSRAFSNHVDQHGKSPCDRRAHGPWQYLHKWLYECLSEEVRASMRKYRLPSYSWGGVSLIGVRKSSAPTTANAEFQSFPQEAYEVWSETPRCLSAYQVLRNSRLSCQQFNFRQHHQEQAMSSSTRLSLTELGVPRCQLSGSNSCTEIVVLILSSRRILFLFCNSTLFSDVWTWR